MLGVKIQDKRISGSGGRTLNFDLRDILAVIGEPIRKARWRCRDLWCTANTDGEPISIREERLGFFRRRVFKVCIQYSPNNRWTFRSS